MNWVKLHTDILDDDKLQRAARKGAKELELLPWIIAFAARANDDGRLTVAGEPAEPDDIAPRLPGVHARRVAACLASLEAIGVLVRQPGDVLCFAAWERRAAKKSDRPESVTDRVRRHRERNAPVTPPGGVTKRDGNADETPCNALQGVSVTPQIEIEIEREIKEGDGDKEKDHLPVASGDATSGSDDPADAPRPVEPPKPPYPPEFEAVWLLYPKRLTPHAKRDAFRAWSARRRAGVEADVLETGVRRYAAHVAAKYGGPSDYVKLPATFFGPAEHYLLDWPAEIPDAPASSSRPAWLVEREEREAAARRADAEKKLGREVAGVMAFVEARAREMDGSAWWARMRREADEAGVHPVLYAHARRHEPATPEMQHAS